MGPMTDSGKEHPRQYPRQRVLKAGLIIFENRTSTIDVLLRDVSEGGAKLKLAQPMPLPDHFFLRLQDATTQKTENHRCEKRWQRGDLVGVTFVAETRANDAPVIEAPLESKTPKYRLLKPNSTLFQDR